MDLRSYLNSRLRLPVLCAPMFRASTPDLLIAQSRAGLVGAMPSRSVRNVADLPKELGRIGTALGGPDDPDRRPFAVNLIVHRSNPRLDHDLDCCLDAKVPIIITSLGLSRALIDRVHGQGGFVLHDDTNVRHARKAIDAGVDGIVGVSVGAGGHAGPLSPFALMAELRRSYSGPIALGGAITTGRALLAALALGADYGYLGTRFIASQESGVVDEYRQMIVASTAEDIVLSDWMTGVPANFLRASFVAASFDPDDMPPQEQQEINVATDRRRPSWGDFWGAGQGVGAIDDCPSVQAIVDRMVEEFDEGHKLLQRNRHGKSQ